MEKSRGLVERKACQILQGVILANCVFTLQTSSTYKCLCKLDFKRIFKFDYKLYCNVNAHDIYILVLFLDLEILKPSNKVVDSCFFTWLPISCLNIWNLYFNYSDFLYSIIYISLNQHWSCLSNFIILCFYFHNVDIYSVAPRRILSHSL